MRRSLLGCCLLPLLLPLAGCDGREQRAVQAARLAQRQAIPSEPTGPYFIGRRYFDTNYKFWGYLRRPGEPWKDARLVMLNEKQKLAPDRQIRQFGFDNNVEYEIYGHYTGDTVYEPVSNRFLPEFVLTGYEVRNRNPPSIFPPGDREAIKQPD